MSNRQQDYIHNGNNERSPFITEPVRLTPAWEANNLPNDELNFKGMTMERVKMEMSPPFDKWKLVFLIFCLHGLGALMPWNMFITAKKYFVDFKLNSNYTGIETQHATYFLSSIGFAAQIPNFAFNWLNVFVQLGGDLTKRIVWSLSIAIVIFIVTVILAMVDSSSWPGAFFWITMISVVVLNMANGIYQNTVFGMAASLPIKYTGAVILGSNISGLFATIISILTSIVASSNRTAAIYYFITAMFVLLICFDTYFALPLNKFYRYHQILQEKEAKKYEKGSSSTYIPYWKIFRQAFPQLLNIFLIFFVTLAVFPAVHSDIKLIDDDIWFPVKKGSWFSEKYFVDITCFLTFNLFAMLGSLTTSWITWPSPKHLVFPVVIRLVFIPLFFFCNYRPLKIDRSIPVLITNNWIYWIIAVIMSYSSGYLSSLAMMYAPSIVEPKYARTAGMFAGAMLITGITSGILFSLVYPIIVENIVW